MVVIYLDRHPLARRRQIADRPRRDNSHRLSDPAPNSRLFPLIRTRRAKSRASS